MSNYYWKKFHTWSRPNYNMTENASVDKILINNEFKTLDIV